MNPQMIYKTEEAESAVPIPEKVTVTKEGIAPAFLTSNLRINVPSASPAVTNDTTDTADISNVTDTTNVTDVTNVTEVANAPAEETAEPTEEVAQMEPDRIVFQGGPGKFQQNFIQNSKITDMDVLLSKRQSSMPMANCACARSSMPL